MHLVFSKNRSLDSTYKGESELNTLGLMAETEEPKAEYNVGRWRRL